MNKLTPEAIVRQIQDIAKTKHLEDKLSKLDKQVKLIENEKIQAEKTSTAQFGDTNPVINSDPGSGDPPPPPPPDTDPPPPNPPDAPPTPPAPPPPPPPAPPAPPPGNPPQPPVGPPSSPDGGSDGGNGTGGGTGGGSGTGGNGTTIPGTNGPVKNDADTNTVSSGDSNAGDDPGQTNSVLSGTWTFFPSDGGIPTGIYQIDTFFTDTPTLLVPETSGDNINAPPGSPTVNGVIGDIVDTVTGTVLSVCVICGGFEDPDILPNPDDVLEDGHNPWIDGVTSGGYIDYIPGKYYSALFAGTPAGFVPQVCAAQVIASINANPLVASNTKPWYYENITIDTILGSWSFIAHPTAIDLPFTVNGVILECEEILDICPSEPPTPDMWPRSKYSTLGFKNGVVQYHSKDGNVPTQYKTQTSFIEMKGKSGINYLIGPTKMGGFFITPITAPESMPANFIQPSPALVFRGDKTLAHVVPQSYLPYFSPIAGRDIIKT